MNALRTAITGVLLLFAASCFFSIAVNSLALGLLAILWIAQMVVERRWNVLSTPFDWFFLAYVIAELLATAFSVNQPQSILFSKRLLLIGVVYAVVTHLRQERDLRLFLVVLLGSAVVVAGIGVVKLLLADPGEVVRLGIFQFYMTTSELMMIALLLVLPFAIFPGVPRRVRVAGIVALVPLAIALYATVTRGAYLAAAAGALFIGLVGNKKMLVPLLVIIALVVLFAPPYIEQRLASIVDPGHPENATRLALWETGITIFKHYPVFGVGDIDLRELYDQYAEVENPEHHGHLHNVPLQVLVTLGSVGFVALYALFVRIAITEWKIYRRVRNNWFRGSVALGALGVFVGFHVMGLTEWSFGDQEIVILFWITVGLALAVGRVPAAAGQDRQKAEA
jgi:O-antigen ligase